MAEAQNQTLTVDSLAGTTGENAQRSRVLVLRSSNLLAAPAALIATCLAGEGWSAAVAGGGLRSDTGFGSRLRSFRHLVREMSSCDVVHIPCASTFQILREALPSLILARFVGRRTILHFVSPEIETLLEKRRHLLLPVLRLADCVVVGSRHLQKTLVRSGLSVRVLTAPVSPEGLAHRVRTRLQPKILVQATLETDANVQASVRAFRLVKQKYPRAELVVIGDGTQRRSLEDLVARGNIVGVEFRGRLDQAGIDRAMDECDLFLHAPLADESPTALVRAFSAGLPVVTSDADGLLHMVRDRVNALIVPIGDHVGLSHAILELVENQDLCIKLSQQGLQEFEKYSWSRVRQDWVNLYNTLRSTS